MREEVSAGQPARYLIPPLEGPELHPVVVGHGVHVTHDGHDGAAGVEVVLEHLHDVVGGDVVDAGELLVEGDAAAVVHELLADVLEGVAGAVVVEEQLGLEVDLTLVELVVADGLLGHAAPLGHGVLHHVMHGGVEAGGGHAGAADKVHAEETGVLVVLGEAVGDLAGLLGDGGAGGAT
eukprot:130567_1